MLAGLFLSINTSFTPFFFSFFFFIRTGGTPILLPSVMDELITEILQLLELVGTITAHAAKL